MASTRQAGMPLYCQEWTVVIGAPMALLALVTPPNNLMTWIAISFFMAPLLSDKIILRKVKIVLDILLRKWDKGLEIGTREKETSI
jgi:hypothetical protein